MSEIVPEPSPPEVSATPPPKQENALANLLLNVLLPVTILSYCSKETGWYGIGPTKALIVSVAMPVGYQIYDWIKRKKLNTFSIIGMVSVLISGGLGLLKLSAQAFALKEAVIPSVLALLFIWTHRAGKPLARTLLLNPDMIDVKRVDRAIEASGKQPAFNLLLWQTTLTLAGSFMLSAVLNYVLAIFFLQDKVPGSEEYTQAIGKLHGWGFVVIGVPMMAFLIIAFMRMMKGLQAMTGLTQDDIMMPR